MSVHLDFGVILISIFISPALTASLQSTDREDINGEEGKCCGKDDDEVKEEEKNDDDRMMSVEMITRREKDEDGDDEKRIVRMW